MIWRPRPIESRRSRLMSCWQSSVVPWHGSRRSWLRQRDWAAEGPALQSYCRPCSATLGRDTTDSSPRTTPRSGPPAAFQERSRSFGRTRESSGIVEQDNEGGFGFDRQTAVLPLTSEEEALYGKTMGIFPQSVNLTPDFPRSAQLLHAMWEERRGRSLDGILSIDPVAMSYVLTATGSLPFPGRSAASGRCDARPRAGELRVRRRAGLSRHRMTSSQTWAGAIFSCGGRREGQPGGAAGRRSLARSMKGACMSGRRTRTRRSSPSHAARRRCP